jgi:hypothetical protein
LPPELFEVIAEFLAGEFQLGSLANLNVASRVMHEVTSALLWTTVTLDNVTPQWNAKLKAYLKPWVDWSQYEEDIQAVRTAKDTFDEWKDLPGALPENRRYVK